MSHQLHFMRRTGCRVWQIPVGEIHGHYKLGFRAATNGRQPVEIADYWHAKQHADALNANLLDCGMGEGVSGRVFVVWQP